MNIPKTYSEAVQFLDGQSSKFVKGKVATQVRRISRDEIALVYHGTNVVTWKSNGDVTFNSGGYRTRTTKNRMNNGSHFYIYQNRNRWFIAALVEGFGFLKDFYFKDGITFQQKI